jgi:hypothetical protein
MSVPRIAVQPIMELAGEVGMGAVVLKQNALVGAKTECPCEHYGALLGAETECPCEHYGIYLPVKLLSDISGK